MTLRDKTPCSKGHAIRGERARRPEMHARPSPRLVRKGQWLSLSGVLALTLTVASAEAQSPAPGASAGAPQAPAGAPQASASAPQASASAPQAPASPPPAGTSQAPPNAAQADALFTEGFKLLEAQRYAEACAKLGESQRLDPAPGTAFNLAKCEEGQGHFGAATRWWREAIARFPENDTRRAEAQKNVEIAEAKAVRLMLRMAPDAPKGTAVSLDDRPLEAKELTAAVVVDVGTHRIVVKAPGRESRDFTVTGAAGELKEVALTPGPAVPPTATTAPVATTTAVLPVVPPVPTSQSAGDFLAQHKGSFATLGVGVGLGIAAGAVGINIINGNYSKFVAKCQADGACLPEDQAAMKGQEIAVNVLAGAAGVAGVTAVVLFFAAEGGLKPRPSQQVSLALGPMGVSLTVNR